MSHSTSPGFQLFSACFVYSGDNWSALPLLQWVKNFRWRLAQSRKHCPPSHSFRLDCSFRGGHQSLRWHFTSRQGEHRLFFCRLPLEHFFFTSFSALNSPLLPRLWFDPCRSGFRRLYWKQFGQLPSGSSHRWQVLALPYYLAYWSLLHYATWPDRLART